MQYQRATNIYSKRNQGKTQIRALKTWIKNNMEDLSNIFLFGYVLLFFYKCECLAEHYCFLWVSCGPLVAWLLGNRGFELPRCYCNYYFFPLDGSVTQLSSNPRTMGYLNFYVSNNTME